MQTHYFRKLKNSSIDQHFHFGYVFTILKEESNFLQIGQKAKLIWEKKKKNDWNSKQNVFLLLETNSKASISMNSKFKTAHYLIRFELFLN